MACSNITLIDENGSTVLPEDLTSGQVVYAVVTPPDGFHILQWVDGNGNTLPLEETRPNVFKIKVECSTTYRVQFVADGDNDCIVTVSVNIGAGTNSARVSGLECGVIATLTAYPGCCYDFVNWSNGDTANPTTIVPTSGENIIVANFVEKDFTLTSSVNDSTMGYVTISNNPVKCGDSVTVTAIPYDGYSFKQWGDGSTEPVLTFTYQCNAGISATFEATFVKGATVVYHSGDDSYQDPNSYTSGATATVLSNMFTLTHFTFSGWSTCQDSIGYGVSCTSDPQCTCYDPNDTITMGSSDVHLYAVWEADEYTLTYDINGGTGTTPASVTNIGGYQFSLADDSTFSKAGFIFGGWVNQNSGQTYTAGSTYTLVADVTLYAIWNEEAVTYHTVTYNSNYPAGTDTDTATQSVADGGSVTTLTDPFSYTDYTLLSWNSTADGTGTSYGLGTSITNITADLTLYAQWGQSLVIFNANKTGVTPATITRSGVPNNTTTAPYMSAFSSYGDYSLLGWGTQTSDTTPTYVAGDSVTFPAYGSTTTLYAIWKANTHTVSFNGNNYTGGTLPSALSGANGDSTAIPSSDIYRDGCGFIGWSTDPEGSVAEYEAGDTYTFGTTDIILYAIWDCCSVSFNMYEDNMWTRGTMDINGVTYNTADPDKGIVVYADPQGVTYDVNANSGYYFVGWLCTDAGDGTSENMKAGYYINCNPGTSGSYQYVELPAMPETGDIAGELTYPFTLPTNPETAFNYYIYTDADGIEHYYQLVYTSDDCDIEISCGSSLAAVVNPCVNYFSITEEEYDNTSTQIQDTGSIEQYIANYGSTLASNTYIAIALTNRVVSYYGVYNHCYTVSCEFSIGYDTLAVQKVYDNTIIPTTFEGNYIKYQGSTYRWTGTGYEVYAYTTISVTSSSAGYYDCDLFTGQYTNNGTPVLCVLIPASTVRVFVWNSSTGKYAMLLKDIDYSEGTGSTPPTTYDKDYYLLGGGILYKWDGSTYVAYTTAQTHSSYWAFLDRKYGNVTFMRLYNWNYIVPSFPTEATMAYESENTQSNVNSGYNYMTETLVLSTVNGLADITTSTAYSSVIDYNGSTYVWNNGSYVQQTTTATPSAYLYSSLPTPSSMLGGCPYIMYDHQLYEWDGSGYAAVSSFVEYTNTSTSTAYNVATVSSGAVTSYTWFVDNYLSDMVAPPSENSEDYVVIISGGYVVDKNVEGNESDATTGIYSSTVTLPAYYTVNIFGENKGNMTSDFYDFPRLVRIMKDCDNTENYYRRMNNITTFAKTCKTT